MSHLNGVKKNQKKMIKVYVLASPTNEGKAKPKEELYAQEFKGIV